MEYIENEYENSRQRIVLLWSALWINLLVVAFFYLHETHAIDFVHFSDDCKEFYAAIGGFTISLVPLVWALMLQRAKVDAVHWIAVGVYVPLALLEAMICFMGLAFCDFNLAAFG